MRINNYKRFILAAIVYTSFTGMVNGQVSGNNIMEYQLGNIPEVEPKDLSTLYDQLNVQYKYKGQRSEFHRDANTATEQADICRRA